MKRRDFIKLVGGTTTALATISGCNLDEIAYLQKTMEEWPLGIERSVSSVCLLCPGGCGIKIRAVDDKVVKIEGNPLHSANRGKLCPLGQAGAQVLYNPDRLRNPLINTGKRGSEKWKSLNWEDAVNIVSSKLKELRNKKLAHTVAFISGNYNSTRLTLIEKFMKAYGSPNHIKTYFTNGMIQGQYLTQGIMNHPVYNILNSNYILSFGCDFLGNWRSPLQAHKAYGYLRQGRKGIKTKFIQVDTRLSPTAAKADKWIPINPGTEGALALSIAYVIIKDELYNIDFIKEHTFGFEDWTGENGTTHIGFKTLVLRDYKPEDVSDITGIPIDTIIRIAKEFATSLPAVAMADSEVTQHTNGVCTAMAIHSLNALVGSIDAPGGVLVQKEVPLTELPEIELDAIASKCINNLSIDVPQNSKLPLCTAEINVLSDAIINGKPYEVNALILDEVNPLFTSSNPKHLKTALSKIPFIISFSSFMDETTKYADIILPDHSYLEKWDDSIVPSITGTPIYGIAQPAVKPFFNTMNTIDVILKIAKNIGGAVSASMPWQDAQELIKNRARGLFDAKRGTIFTDTSIEDQIRLLEERGWWLQNYDNFDDFWDDLLEKGGWWDPFYSYGEWGSAFLTPSNKFEFFSQIFKQKFDVEGDETFLPHFEKPRIKPKNGEYPFVLLPYKTLAFGSGAGANLPWLQEIIGTHVNTKWNSWIEINPEDAKKNNIQDKDEVWVESSEGRIKTIARIYPGTMPGHLNFPVGQGHTDYGRWANNKGANPNSILEYDVNRLSGLPVLYSTRVKIYKT